MVALISEYGLFLAKVVTFSVAVLLVVGGLIGAIGNAKREAKDSNEGSIQVSHLNKNLEQIKEALQHTLVSDEVRKSLKKEKKKEEKAKKKASKKAGAIEDNSKGRIFVLDFDGDIRASAVESLRREISAIMQVAKQGDEVLLRLESPGGLVHAYGLAASQLQRIRNAGLKLTIAVDKVAASGGYMMACIGDRILAAPFSVIGSIGVVAQVPNVHRLLKKHDVDVDVLTAGEYKRTLTMLGENTDAGREKFIQELEDTHGLFKEFVRENRRALDIDKVATGEHWYGAQAKQLGLVDEISTSDDYLLDNCTDADVYLVSWQQKQSLADRLGFAAEAAAQKAMDKWVASSFTSWFK